MVGVYGQGVGAIYLGKYEALARHFSKRALKMDWEGRGWERSILAQGKVYEKIEI